MLAAATLGLITRTTRASMLDNLHQDYVRVARAKGLREGRIVNGHVLPNALIPIVTLGGLAYANLLTGAVMTETVFSWPGLGRYTFRSAEALDFPAIMGITLVVALTYLIINLAHRSELRAPRSEGCAVTAFDQASATLAAIAPVRTKGQRWRRRYGVAALGAAIILVWIFVALACPLLTRYSPNAVDVTPSAAPALERAHWLGTDELGRDVLTRLLYGSRISLVTGFVVVALGAAFGTLARRRRGLHARARRRADHAPDRPRPVLPTDHPCARHRGRARHRHHQHHHRHAGRVVAEIRAARAQPRARAALAGICGSGRGRRPQARPHPARATSSRTPSAR